MLTEQEEIEDNLGIFFGVFVGSFWLREVS